MKKRLFVMVLMVMTAGAYAQSVTVSMARVRGGMFTMGSPVTDTSRGDDENPRKQVTVSNFFMSRYPVTQAQYQSVMGVNPSQFKGGNLPVENVSWYDAVEYCNALSRRDGLTPVYMVDKERKDVNNKNGSYDTLGWLVMWNRNANGYRLPTEAEWEYACRAGTTAPFGGTSVDAMAWYLANSEARTQPVGKKEPNGLGIYDMYGNVWEWCWDWYANYTSAPQADPTGPSAGFYRVFRGGFFNSVHSAVRSAVRGNAIPSTHEENRGFRIAQNAPGITY